VQNFIKVLVRMHTAQMHEYLTCLCSMREPRP